MKDSWRIHGGHMEDSWRTHGFSIMTRQTADMVLSTSVVLSRATPGCWEGRGGEDERRVRKVRARGGNADEGDTQCNQNVMKYHLICQLNQACV